MMPSQITATLGEVVSAEVALQQTLTVKLDAKTRYHALKLAKFVAVETKHYRDEHHALVKELGAMRGPTEKEMAQGQLDDLIEVLPKNRLEFVKRLKDLSDIPVTLPWGPLTRVMLDPYSDVTGSVCCALGVLFELDPDEKQVE